MRFSMTKLEKGLATPEVRRGWVNTIDPYHDRYNECRATRLKRRHPRVYDTLFQETATAKFRDLATTGASRPNKRSDNKAEARLARILSRYLARTPSLKDELVSLGAKDWFPDLRTEELMNALRERAKAGLPRPNKRSDNPEERQLGKALGRYTNANSQTYREGFKEELLRLGAKNWFPDLRTEELMNALRERAKASLPRPDKRSDDPEERQLGRALGRYTDANGGSFREGFKEELANLGAKNWFTDIRVASYIETLRQMARERKPRPKLNSKLGIALNNLIADSIIFKAELIDLGASHWFMDSRTGTTMDHLRRLAESGAPRPSVYSSDPKERKLGETLGNYLRKKDFKGELVALGATHWFPDMRIAATLDRLRELAQSSLPRPNARSKDPEEARLGNALSNATDEFKQEIAAMCDWFDPNAIARRRKKGHGEDVLATMEKLRNMARFRAGRPSQKSRDPDERKLGIALGNLLQKHPEFQDELIQLGAVDWFGKAAKRRSKGVSKAVAAMMERLREMAKAGIRRPDKRSSDREESHIGVLLTNYVKFYPEFRAELIDLGASHWFKRKQS